MKEKICPKCGKSFTAHGLQKYCNSCWFDITHSKRQLPNKVCEICGKEYTPKNSRQKYCDVCRDKKYSEYQHKYYLEVRKKKKS